MRNLTLVAGGLLAIFAVGCVGGCGAEMEDWNSTLARRTMRLQQEEILELHRERNRLLEEILQELRD